MLKIGSIKWLLILSSIKIMCTNKEQINMRLIRFLLLQFIIIVIC